MSKLKKTLSAADVHYIKQNRALPIEELSIATGAEQKVIQELLDSFGKPNNMQGLFAADKKKGVVVMTEAASERGDLVKPSQQTNDFSRCIFKRPE